MGGPVSDMIFEGHSRSSTYFSLCSRNGVDFPGDIDRERLESNYWNCWMSVGCRFCWVVSKHWPYNSMISSVSHSHYRQRLINSTLHWRTASDRRTPTRTRSKSLSSIDLHISLFSPHPGGIAIRRVCLCVRLFVSLFVSSRAATGCNCRCRAAGLSAAKERCCALLAKMALYELFLVYDFTFHAVDWIPRFAAGRQVFALQ